MAVVHGRLAPQQWRVVGDEQFAKAILEDLRAVKAGGVIRIYCGTAHPDVYNDAFVALALELVEYKQASFRAITGPVLVTDERGQNALRTLGDKGVVAPLRHRPTRGDHELFRLVETETGFRYSVESYPPPEDLPRHHREVSVLVEPAEARGFLHATREFFDRAADVFDPAHDETLRALPILLTQAEIDRVRERAAGLGLRFDHLQPDTIRALAGEA